MSGCLVRIPVSRLVVPAAWQLSEGWHRKRVLDLRSCTLARGSVRLASVVGDRCSAIGTKLSRVRGCERYLGNLELILVDLEGLDL